MTAYATVADLAAVALDGWEELAQRTTRDPRVIGELLEQLYNGETPTADADVTALATAALTKLESTLDAVSRYADTYLNQRYRDAIPLAQELYADTGLPFAVASIAMGRLYGVNQSDELRKTIAQSESYLRDLASGVASLNYQQASTPEAPGKMHVKAKSSAFDWSGY
ncbi:phage protein Gp36 family protein [Gynuella sp.]|uniref:phage protein Gp36 family protein n=1 Tax=Gynuella sp. TaxID=2969146 RepID=UPI003D0A7667